MKKEKDGIILVGGISHDEFIQNKENESNEHLTNLLKGILDAFSNNEVSQTPNSTHYIDIMIQDSMNQIDSLKTLKNMFEHERKIAIEDENEIIKLHQIVKNRDINNKRRFDSLGPNYVSLSKINQKIHSRNDFDSKLNLLKTKDEPLIIKKQKQQVKEDFNNRLKNEYRANLLYGRNQKESLIDKFTYKKMKEFLNSPYNSNIKKSFPFLILYMSGKNNNMHEIFEREQVTVFDSPNDLPLEYRQDIINKLISQELDLNSKGVLFNCDFNLTQELIKTKTLKSYVKNKLNINMSEFKALDTSNKDFSDGSIVFKLNEPLFYFSIRKADIKNLKIEENGCLSGDLIDTTDYNRATGDLSAANNNNMPLVTQARKLQLEGEIQPRFLIIHFVIPPKMLKEIIKN